LRGPSLNVPDQPAIHLDRQAEEPVALQGGAVTYPLTQSPAVRSRQGQLRIRTTLVDQRLHVTERVRAQAYVRCRRAHPWQGTGSTGRVRRSRLLAGGEAGTGTDTIFTR